MNFRSYFARLSSQKNHVRTLLPASLLAALCGMFGCANPEASFNGFAERYDEIFANKPPTACPDAYVPLSAGGADGPYLLVLSATQKPDEPILFFAEVTTPAVGGGVGIAITVTPVAKADRQTLAGDPQVYEAAVIDDSGKFELAMPDLKVPKDANTIIGLDVAANVVLKGNICGDGTFVCGDVTGTTISPAANLEGSTFTLMRAEDGQPLPDPVLDCEETPAKPLP
ncbi:MAG: hypothetical protein IPK82_42020 [Polyangiaceae bacterium]|nr:hypothetical protein [Polyangiaceae bacterium]